MHSGLVCIDSELVCHFPFLSLSLSLSLSQSYAAELEKTRGPPHIVPGGFHLNPKGIELALRVSPAVSLIILIIIIRIYQ